MKLVRFVLLFVHLPLNHLATASDLDNSMIINRIGHDIAGLKSAFPQLKGFSVDKNVYVDKLQIIYQYNTHKAKHHGGWTAKVPNPDSNGVWFYIDLYDVASRAQIHTQPITMPMCLNNKRVSFLILGGDNTKSVREMIGTILKSHGMKRCE